MSSESKPRQVYELNLTNNVQDREEALKDDFQFESGTYGYDESDDEWDDEEANWNGGENEQEQQPTAEGKDESTAYLEFLNEEVSMPMDMSRVPSGSLDTYGYPSFKSLLTRTATRHKSSRQQTLKSRTMSSARIVCCWSRRSTGSILTSPSGILSRVSGVRCIMRSSLANTVRRIARRTASVLRWPNDPPHPQRPDCSSRGLPEGGYARDDGFAEPFPDEPSAWWSNERHELEAHAFDLSSVIPQRPAASD